MTKNTHYSLVLANSLTSDCNEEFDLFANQQAQQNQGQDQGSNLIDQYDYVMHGKIFEDKVSENNENL